MARIRTIKPEFWKHEALSELPEATHMLAAALLNYADDFGYFNANPRLIQAECSPLREPSVSIPESLRSLQTIGYLVIGTGADGKRYGRILNFSEHQRVSHPTASKISTISVTWEDKESSPEEFRNPPEAFRPEGNRERKGKEGKGEVPSEPVADATELSRGTSPEVQRVFDHWRREYAKPRAQLDAKRRKAIAGALKAGYAVDDLCRSIDGYKHSPHHMGGNDRRTVYDDIALFLRDAQHIDAGLKFHDDPPLTGVSDRTLRIVDQTRDWRPPELRNAAN